MDRCDVLVIGGGNAGLCAAIEAADLGARVTLLEREAEPLRGGNSRHTRNIRLPHVAADRFVTDSYPPAELEGDLRDVTGGECDPDLTHLLASESMSLVEWMEEMGSRWQLPLHGTLQLSRTNRFFLGGGKTLINAYYREAERRGIRVHLSSEVTDLAFQGSHCSHAGFRRAGVRDRIEFKAVVIASGGFEANLSWLRRSWGAAVDQFIVRGTPANDGRVLGLVMRAGALPIGNPREFHAVAVDARSPRYDGGIVTRVDVIPFGIVVNRHALRFYDEGEDLWPKRYAIWGRLVAEQDGQMAYAIFESRHANAFIPPLYPPLSSPTIPGLAAALGLDPDKLMETVREYNHQTQPGCSPRFEELDNCSTHDLVPPKSNWATPILVPPFHAFPIRPGITFTYYGVAVDSEARVRTASGTFDNVYAAGEAMAGNILSHGYLAGVGMTIGTVFGRLAGRSAASHV